MKTCLYAAAVLWALAVPGATLVAQSRTYTNPILDESFPDPTILKVGNIYYAYGTGAQTGSSSATPYIVMTTSTDLVHWTHATTVLSLPEWGRGETWAPHVIKDPATANRYLMYFSAKADPTSPNVPDADDKCIGVAVATSPAGPFVGQTKPVTCGGGRDIDPMAFHDEVAGKWFLFWGSSATVPMSRRELSADLLGFAPGSTAVDVINGIPGNKYSQLVEGAWVLDHGQFRYLFMSGKHCCRGDDDYAVTVARKPLSELSGPWERYAGGDTGAILKMNATWRAPGHNGVFVDGAGQYWMIYHARRPNSTKRVLLMDRIVWQDDWPRIASDSPSTGAMSAPVP